MSNIVYLSASSGDLCALVSGLSGGATIFMDCAGSLTGNLTIPANVHLTFCGDATLDFAAYDMTGSNSAITAPRAQIFNFSSTGRLKGTFANEFHVEHFGADSTGSVPKATQTRKAFQYLYDYIFQSTRNNQGYDAWGPAYQFDGTGVTWSCSHYTIPTARGCPGLGTEIRFSPSSEAAAFLYTGGGGHVSNARMDNFVFSGNANTIGLELRGPTGMRGTIGMINPLKVGVLLSTMSGQSAPELNVFDIYTNNLGDANAMECRNNGGVGQGSMHGSGLGPLTCISRASTTSNQPTAVIKVGSGCALYNASVEGHYWNQTTQPLNLVENHSSGFDCSISNSVTSMEFNDSAPMNMADPRYNNVYFRHMPFVQGSHTLGIKNAIITNYQSYNTSIITRQGAAYGQEVPNLGSSNACPLNMPGGLSGSNPRIYSIFMESGDTNWQWQGYILATPGPGTSGAGGCLAIGKTVKDTKNWGNPTFDTIGYTTQLRLASLSGSGVSAEGIYCLYDVFDL